MKSLKGFAPCLWFDTQAEEAADVYCAIFPNSRITGLSRYGHEGKEIHGGEAGAVLSVTFELDGHAIRALNGGPMFKFSPAISFSVECRDQEEVDYYNDRLLADGGTPSQCGWLDDRFGLSWQIVPSVLHELLGSADRVRADRAMKAMLTMKKLDIAALQEAYDG